MKIDLEKLVYIFLKRKSFTSMFVYILKFELGIWRENSNFKISREVAMLKFKRAQAFQFLEKIISPTTI